MAKHLYVRVGRHKFDLANITVEPVLFLYMLTQFNDIPIFQSLIFDKVCLQMHSNEFCKDIQNNNTFKKEHKDEADAISSDTSHWILNTNIASLVPSIFVVTIFLGPLGDKFGRKIPVLLFVIGSLFKFVCSLLNAYFMSASLFYLLIGPVINGFFGGITASLMACYSYIGHISDARSKMTRLGILESMTFLAGTIGIFVSGLILESVGYVFTYVINISLLVLTILYILLWIDNIRPDAQDGVGGGCGEILKKFFKDSAACVSRPRERRVFSSILLQVLVLDVLMLVTTGDMDISFLYVKDKFNFSQTYFGYFKGLDNFLRGLVLVTVLPLVKKYLSVKDLLLVLIGLVSYAASFAIVGTASATWVLFFSAVIGMLKGIPSAGLRATMSSMVTTGEQGRLFGIIAASESVVSLMASFLYNELYPATINSYPNMCYMISVGLVLLDFLIIVYLYFTMPSDVTPPYQTVVESDALEDETVSVQA